MSTYSKTTALQDLQPHLASFYKIAVGAWNDYQSLPDWALVSFTSRSRASAVHDLIVTRASAYCEQTAEVIQFEISGMKGILVANKYAIRFKKLDNSGLSRNQPTLQVKQFRSQECLDGLPDLVHLELGYITDQFQTEVSEIRLVCPSGSDANSWEVAINDSTTLSVVEDLFDRAAANDIGETKMKPKAGKKQGENVVNMRNIRNVD